jgi:hypothetical protein
LGFGPLAGRHVYPAGQPVVERADHRDLAGPQVAVALGGGGQGGWDRFAGQAVARAQVARLLDAPGGLGAADQCGLGDGMDHCAAEFNTRCLAGKGIDHRVLDSGDTPTLPFAALQHRQLLAPVQCVEVQRAGSIPGDIERVEYRVDILLIRCTHTAKLTAPTDKNRGQNRHGCTLAQ